MSDSSADQSGNTEQFRAFVQRGADAPASAGWNPVAIVGVVAAVVIVAVVIVVLAVG